MARLTLEQVKEIIKRPKNKTYIDRAIRQEDRLIFHSEPLSKEGLQTSNAYKDFLAWVESLLPKNKFNRFVQVMNYPVETVDTTESIYKQLKKVFDAQDKYFNYEFTTSELQQDFTDYLSELQDEYFWPSQGYKAFKIGINSFIVCDWPVMQEGSRPEPYYYILNIRNVIDVDVDEDENRVEYIVFNDCNDRIIVIDEEHYFIFERPGDGKEHEYKDQVQHTRYTEGGRFIEGIGYCPVKSFWDESIYGDKGINKRQNISDVLGKLDWLLFYRTAKKYLETYTFPIIVTYRDECDYQDAEGNACQSGFIHRTLSNPIIVAGGSKTTQITEPCPACNNSDNDLMGPGTEWLIDAPRTKDQPDLMENPLKIVPMPTDNLEHCVQEIQRREDEIILKSVGYDGEAINKESLNEVQVHANFESKESVLFSIKEEFEKTIKFAHKTIARMRYGNMFLRAEVNLGEEFYLKEVEDLLKTYAEAQKNGMPQHFISKLSEQIQRTKFRNNTEQLTRNSILNHLEPYPDYTIQELKNLGVNEYDELNFIIKLNFTTFIRRFERENTNIIEFGSLLDLKNKISIILKTLQGYAGEYQQARKDSGARDDEKSTETTSV